MTAASFGRVSKTVANKFLSSVVVVDDQALLSVSIPGTDVRTLNVPGRQGGVSVASRVAVTEGSTDAAHRLDAKKLTDSFARQGMVCSILRPDQAEVTTLEKTVAKIAGNSDVIILDWVLHEFKQGEITVSIIKTLLRKSELTKGRSRLIIVYTGEQNLDGIASAIRKAIGISEQDPSDPFTIERGSARICIYAKEQSRLTSSQQLRKIKADELPGTVINEFANMTRGLISNVALSALAALRANTYQLLKRFHRDIDAPYVTHSTLSIPDDSSVHLIPLIVSEIQAILEDEGVADLASTRNIVGWINHQFAEGLDSTLGGAITEAECRQGFKVLVEGGLDKPSLDTLSQSHQKFFTSVLTSKNKAQDCVRDRLTRALTLEKDKDRVSDQELAVLMSIRSRYARPLPRLSLGTIVMATETKDYWLCFQPRCDSVRLHELRFFPFLPLKIVEDGKPFDFIVVDKANAIRLLLNDKPSCVRMIAFEPTSGKQVIARRLKGGEVFTAAAEKGTAANADSKKKRSYRWVADLKPDHAQRVANEYAVQLSRVGLTESEWLRKWMPRTRGLR